MRKDKDEPLYMISIVSRMLRVHPQTLRMYEREGLVAPRRSGNQRLYSEADLERLNVIINLTRDLGVNKAGVDIILRMRHRLESLQHEVEGMMHFLEGGVREDFEDKIRRIFFEEEEE